MRASFSSSGLLSIGLWLRWYWHACRRLLLKKPLAAANERKKHDRANVNSTHPTQKRERRISNTFHFSIYMVWIWKKVSKLWIFWVRSIHVEGFQSSNPQSSSSLSWSLSSSSSSSGHQHWFPIICRHVLTSWLAADYLQSRSLSPPPSLCHRNWNHDYD